MDATNAAKDYLTYTETKRVWRVTKYNSPF